jgi:hypothetical protein
MWLETFVWVWGPIVCVCSVWTVWRSAATMREIRALRARVAELEMLNDSTKRGRRAA